MNNLLVRTLTALVILPVVAWDILYGGTPFIIMVVLLALAILWEWNGICEGKSYSMTFVVQALGLVLFSILLYQNGHIPGPYISGYVALVIIVAIFSGSKIPFAIMGSIYALLPTLALIWLRSENDQAGWVVLWMMGLVWAMDTGAYFAGKSIGGPKMAPRISPNKTWAGLIGGTIAAVIVSGLVAYFFEFQITTIMLVTSACLAVWSQMGDLAESALKRRFNVKDSGRIIPGHGGVMDRVDGIVFVAPVVALLVKYQWLVLV